MRKFLYSLSAVAFLLFTASSVKAITITYTTFIGTGSSSCATSGYISPSTHSFNQGDEVTINFKNEKIVDLQIRDFPGGNFNVSANTTVGKSFTADSSFTFTAWLTDGSCQKASSIVTVQPKASPPPPPPPPANPPAQTPPPSPPTAPDEPVSSNEQPIGEPTVQDAEQSTNATDSAESINKERDGVSWLVPALILTLLGLTALIIFLWKRKRRQTRA